MCATMCHFSVVVGFELRLAETWAVAPLAGAGRLGAPLATGGPALGFGYLLGGGVG